MTSFLSIGFENRIKNKILYLDNDFLGELYYDRELATSFLDLTLGHSTLIIDPLTKFEFLRSVYIDVKNREAFISPPAFVIAMNVQEKFIKIYNQALILSKIYAHKNNGVKASTVDLLLAGRITLESPTSTKIITANKRDFPSCLFDIEGTISKVKKDESIQTYSLLSFNPDKFESAKIALDRFR